MSLEARKLGLIRVDSQYLLKRAGLAGGKPRAACRVKTSVLMVMTGFAIYCRCLHHTYCKGERQRNLQSSATG